MKNKPTIFITAVCGDIGYSAVRSLREVAGKIIVCDVRSLTPVRDLIDEIYEAPLASDSKSYISFIKEVIEKEKVDIFLPISEPEIEVINKHRQCFNGLDVALMLNNQEIIDVFLDKFKTAKALEKLDIRVPHTILLNECVEDFVFPLIIKSRKGCGSKKLWVINDKNDLEYVKLRTDNSFLVQEYIGNPDEEYTTGVFSDGKKVSSITFKRRLAADGTTVEAEKCDEPELDHYANLICSHFNVIGAINIQSRKQNSGCVVFEINPRLSGTLPIRKKFGFDDAVWWVNALQGQTYEYKPLYKMGKAIRCYSEEYFNLVKVK